MFSLPRVRLAAAGVLLGALAGLGVISPARAEDGYRLWLRYDRIEPEAVRAAYGAQAAEIVVRASSPTLVAARDELVRGLRGLLDIAVPVVEASTPAGAIVLGTPAGAPEIAALGFADALAGVGEEGYVLRHLPAADGRGARLVVAANRDVGVLYGVFDLLRRLQSRQPLERLDVASAPKIARRVLNHWDDLDGFAGRNYAGFSLWDWFELPDIINPRYRDYARANASVGINGMVPTSVNAEAILLTAPYLRKAAALADVLRPYGIRLYLAPRFTSPKEIGGLPTSDPLDPAVRAWWAAKVDEIYALVPDFGGFLVKANSEGEPGPGDFGRSHADGANLLADALAPHGGIVMWRAFVYDHHVPDDRVKQAYHEFQPLDGVFRSNVMVQVKNGPLDFMPREPFSPLFGAMPRTPLALEVQITEEYFGSGVHLVFLAPLYEECLDADTFRAGPGSTVARVVDGDLHNHALSAIAGVANIGTDRNWTGHPFGASNWYAFGRLAWDHGLDSAAIAEEWARLTFTNDPATLRPLLAMMLESRQAVVNYMNPLGLHHIMAEGHHYGPGPWVDLDEAGRPDWTSVYYHRADASGLGFDRTASGSNAIAQYRPEVQARFRDLATCPEDYLLWFHHVPWDHRMQSGRTLWEELCARYQLGVDTVRGWQRTWADLQSAIDPERHAHVTALLARQEHDARWWRDACLLYFQTFSQRPFPAGYEQPAHTLEYYRNLRLHHVPGHRG